MQTATTWQALHTVPQPPVVLLFVRRRLFANVLLGYAAIQQPISPLSALLLQSTGAMRCCMLGRLRSITHSITLRTCHRAWCRMLLLLATQSISLQRHMVFPHVAVL